MISDSSEATIDQIVATCNGDIRGALKALLLVNEQLEAELQQLYAAVAHDRLARVRGFALEIADFEIFYLAKYLICNERRLRFQSKTAVVKTYPIPKPDVMRVDSSHHVSAPHRAKEERQVAPLLERGGEQAPR